MNGSGFKSKNYRKYYIKEEAETSNRFAMQFAFKIAIFDASVSPLDPIMAMQVYDIGRISAEPQGAAEMVPSG